MMTMFHCVLSVSVNRRNICMQPLNSLINPYIFGKGYDAMRSNFDLCPRYYGDIGCNATWALNAREEKDETLFEILHP